jgi:uroporphyrinogen III methyltransferase/synthase
LFGRRIIVTRTREQASELVAGLEEAGANCLEYSTINIQPADSYSILDSELERLNEYHWIIFTSLNGVEYFFQRLYARGMDARNLKGPACGGRRSTADLLLKIRVRLIDPGYLYRRGLAESLLDQGVGAEYPYPARRKQGDPT